VTDLPRRIVTGHKSPAHDPEVAVPLLAAAAAVIGLPVAWLADPRKTLCPEVRVVRLAVAVVLVERGWPKAAAAAATGLSRETIACKWARQRERVRTGMPRLVEAAERAASAGALPTVAEATARQREHAASVVRDACNARGITVEQFMGERFDPRAVHARRAAIDALAAEGWSGYLIAKRIGLSNAPVSYWLRHRCTKPAGNKHAARPRPSRTSGVAGAAAHTQ
jgi:transposase